MNEMVQCVSVIIPMYKVEKYLRRCLDSVVSQTYTNLEIIIIDDGSPDKCGEIADEYAKKDARIKVVHKENEGISMARNTGLEHANGDWISFVDSDDEIPSDAIEKMLSYAVKEQVAMVMGGYYVCIHSGSHTKRKQIHVPDMVMRNTYEMHKYFNSQGKNFNFLWMKLYKKEVFDHVRFIKGKYYEDIFAAKDIIEHAGSMAILDEPIYYYHLRSDSISFGNKMEMHMDGLQARLEWRSFIQEKYPPLSPYSQDAVMEYCCYLLGKIKLLGQQKHKREWEFVVSSFREAYAGAAKASLFLKAAIILFKVSPNLLGTMCMQYSKIKNG